MPTPKTIILTGAGISAESGIQTFRAADGLWHDHRIEEVATPEGFEKNPELVHAFYNARRRQLLDPAIRPNAAHLALARWEQACPGEILVITQNVDDLHERAGSRNLVHMHGELLKMRCAVSGEIFPIEGDLHADRACRCCGGIGNLRPHIVWFGEMPLEMDDLYEALMGCDLFVAIGTSGKVYPASRFATIAKGHGALTVELNLEPTGQCESFNKAFYGPASEVVPAFVEKALAVGG